MLVQSAQPPLESHPTVPLFGVGIHAVTMAETLAICQEAIRLRRQLIVGVVNAGKLVSMRSNPVLHDAVVDSDLVLADGMAVVWASRLLGHRLPGRVTGIDLFERLLEHANDQALSVYFLGATPQVLGRLLHCVRTSYPRVRIAGARDGYFDEEESGQIAAAIRAARCDMLFVGISSPKKEWFLAQWGRKTDATICHGVGGAFDVLANEVKRAPPLWQKLGMEWLYRVFQEPRRMAKRYLKSNLLFLGILVRELVSRTNGSGKGRTSC